MIREYFKQDEVYWDRKQCDTEDSAMVVKTLSHMGFTNSQISLMLRFSERHVYRLKNIKTYHIATEEEVEEHLRFIKSPITLARAKEIWLKVK